MATKNTTRPSFRQLISSDRTFRERSDQTTHKQAGKNVFINLPKVTIDLGLQMLHGLSNGLTAYKGIEIADDVKLMDLGKKNELSTFQKGAISHVIENIVNYIDSDDTEGMEKVIAYRNTLTPAQKAAFTKEVNRLVGEGMDKLQAQLSLIK